MKVGRDPSCDLMLNEVIFTGSTDEDLQLAKISRPQFELQRTGTNLVLKDKSMNGTYVIIAMWLNTLFDFFSINTSLAAPGALAHRLQHLTASDPIVSLNVTILSSW